MGSKIVTIVTKKLGRFLYRLNRHIPFIIDSPYIVRIAIHIKLTALCKQNEDFLRTDVVYVLVLYKRAAAAPATTAIARISAAVPATTAAAATADVVMGTAVRVKAVATTAAALREQSKLCAGVRRSSASASFLDQRRNSVVSDTQESPEKIRDADNMNKSFRIDFEDGDLQQEELTCSSCLSIHCDMEQPLCLFCGWKVLHSRYDIMPEDLAEFC